MKLFSPTLWAQIIKELLCVLRDKQARVGLIAPPLMQLFIFSFAVTLDVKNIDIGVYDMDGGAYAQEFVSSIAASKFVGKIVAVHSQEEIEQSIVNGKNLVGIIIPQNFSRDIINKTPPKIELIVDGRRANAGQIVVSYIETIANSMGVFTKTAVDKNPDRTGIRYWFNPTLNYFWFVVPSLAPLLVSISALGVTSMSIARERELGTFDQLLVSPATYLEIIIAKAMPAMIIGPPLGMFMVFAALTFFGVPFTGNFFLLLLSLFVHVYAVIGLGLIISAFSQTQQQAILGVFTIMVPMVLMSGFATPYENMPQFLQDIALSIPNLYTLRIVQGLFLKGQGFMDVLPSLISLMIIGTLSLTASYFIVRNKLQ